MTLVVQLIQLALKKLLQFDWLKVADGKPE